MLHTDSHKVETSRKHWDITLESDFLMTSTGQQLSNGLDVQLVSEQTEQRKIDRQSVESLS